MNFIERTNTVNALFKAANANDTISVEEEMMLINIYKDEKSSEEEKVTARNKLITGNLRYIIKLVKDFAGTGNDFDDLFQESILGIEDALDEYDVTTGTRFWTFAKHYIHQRVNLYLTRTAPLVVPANYTMQPKIKKARARFFQEHEREATEDELIDYIQELYGIKIKNRSDLYGVGLSYIQETYNDDDNREVQDEEFNLKTASMNAFEEASERDEISDSMRKAMLTLSTKEREILCLAYGIGVDRQYKDYEIGEKMNYTSERIRQIRKKAEEKLKVVLSTAKA